MICFRRIFVLDAETTPHWLKDCEFGTHFGKSIGFLDSLFFHGNNLYDKIRHGIDDGSFWLLAGGCGALGTNCVLLMKWYLPILWNSSQWIMLIYEQSVFSSIKCLIQRERSCGMHTKVVIWFRMLMTGVSVIQASQILTDWFEMLMVLEFTVLQVIFVIPTSFKLSWRCYIMVCV